MTNESIIAEINEISDAATMKNILGAINARMPGSIEAFRQTEDFRSAQSAEIGYQGISADCAEPITEISHPQDWRDPLPLPERNLPPFPENVFPKWAQEFVEATAEHTQTPLGLAGFVFLSLLSTLGAGIATIEGGPGWYETLNLFLVSFLPSGSRKSAVFKAILEPYKKHVREVNKRRRENAKESGAPFVPFAPIADDATMETLPEMALNNNERLALLSPEGQLFENAATQYSDKGANIDFLLKAHAGDFYSQSRRGRPFFSLDEPLLTLGITAQPSVLEGLAKKPNFLGKGLLARFLFSLPPDNVGYRTILTQPPSEAISEAYWHGVDRLIALKPDEKNGETTPYVIRFAPDALMEFNRFREINESELRIEGDLGERRDWGGKLPGAIARIVGLLHLARYGTTDLIVSLATLKDALRIADYLKAHALAAFGQMGDTKLLEDARLTRNWILNKKLTQFTLRDLQTAKPTRFPRAEDCKPILELMESLEWIQPAPEPRREGRGRSSSPVYRVNPRLLDKDATPESFGIALKLSTFQTGAVHFATATRQRHKSKAPKHHQNRDPRDSYEKCYYGTRFEYALVHWLRGKGLRVEDWVLAAEGAAPEGADLTLDGLHFEMKAILPGSPYLHVNKAQHHDPKRKTDYYLFGRHLEDGTLTLFAPVKTSEIETWEVAEYDHRTNPETGENATCYRIAHEVLNPHPEHRTNYGTVTRYNANGENVTGDR